MKMYVEFEWDNELGEAWMNEDNLRLLLYGQTYTKPELLSFNVFQLLPGTFVREIDCPLDVIHDTELQKKCGELLTDGEDGV